MTSELGKQASLDPNLRIQEAKWTCSESLDLSGLKLTTVPESLVQLTELKALDLSHNEITAIPDFLGQLGSLEQVNLAANRISSIPDSLAELSNLWRLDLASNKIEAIPDSVARLAKIALLSFSNNGITVIPDSLCQLKRLHVLRLEHNEIDAVPQSLSQIPDLRMLSLSSNRFTAIPDSICRLRTLECLLMGFNQIATIPDALANLPKLQDLWLIRNQITSIPSSLAQLANLEELVLSGNQISFIPDFVGEFRRLRRLELDSNRITAIPDSLSQLSSLRELDLSSNHITTVPASFIGLSELTKVGLEGNPLSEEVLAALRVGVPSFFRLLRSTAKKVYPRTVKLVLLGEPQSGKTTLLEALKGNPHPCDDNRKETIGVNVATIKKVHPADGQQMSIAAWDFAGQHMEHATHQFFLTENAIYLILWNARQGTESGRHDLWYWLELLKMRVRRPKFLLVATHTEHTPPDLNLTEIERSYGGYQGHYPVELEGLKGIDALQARILELAAESPSLRAQWPAEWLVIRDRIRKIRKKQPYMSPTAFRRLMKENHVTGIAQTDLAGQLHNLGEILYFQERPELSNLVILDPEWVAELIALVVRSKGARENHGVLSDTELRKLWKKANLSPKVRNHLLHLMDWFDLIYSTGHKTSLGIVVEALPYSSPHDLKQLALPPGEPQMEMIFRFPSLQRRLPPGIPTWAIARAHRYRKSEPWRDAAAFEDRDTKSQALLLASETAKEIRLSVAGDYPPFFFGLLDSILRDTFKRYPGAEPERRLPCPCRPGCPGSFLYETVLKRWRERKTYVACDRSGEDVAIESLLTGIPRPSTEEGVLALRSEMRRLFTEQLRAHREQMEKTCPSVFTLLPSSDFKQLDTWMEHATKDQELELTLYCEHDSGWHSTNHSVYRFKPDQRWFDLLKGQWNRLVGITKHVGPLAKAVGKAGAISWAEIVGLGIEKLPEASRCAEGWLSRALGSKEGPGSIDIEARHLLEQLIEHLDSSQRSVTQPKKGGLHAYIIDDGRVLWLCPKHLKRYQNRR